MKTIFWSIIYFSSCLTSASSTIIKYGKPSEMAEIEVIDSTIDNDAFRLYSVMKSSENSIEGGLKLRKKIGVIAAPSLGTRYQNGDFEIMCDLVLATNITTCKMKIYGHSAPDANEAVGVCQGRSCMYEMERVFEFKLPSPFGHESVILYKSADKKILICAKSNGGHDPNYIIGISDYFVQDSYNKNCN